MYLQCFNCKGKGITPYRHIANGICFKCNGKGKYKASSEEISLHHEKINNFNDQLNKQNKKYTMHKEKFIQLFEIVKKQLNNGITENDKKALIEQLNATAKNMEDTENEIIRIEKLIKEEKEKFIY